MRYLIATLALSAALAVGGCGGGERIGKTNAPVEAEESDTGDDAGAAGEEAAPPASEAEMAAEAADESAAPAEEAAPEAEEAAPE